jgi:hypothetical protein
MNLPTETKSGLTNKGESPVPPLTNTYTLFLISTQANATITSNPAQHFPSYIHSFHSLAFLKIFSGTFIYSPFVVNTGYFQSIAFVTHAD